MIQHWCDTTPLVIAEVMNMTPTAAMEVLLGLPPLHVMTEAEAQAELCRLMCTQHWRLKSTNFGHTKQSRDIGQEPIQKVGSDKMLLRYVYHKPFTVKFPDKYEWKNRFNPDNKGCLVWCADGYKTNKGTGAGVYRWGSSRGNSFSCEFHTTVFQAEIYTIKAQIMDNIEKSYTGKNIYILSYSQAAIKALDSFKINSKLAWDCHQSLMKLKENNRIQLVLVLRHIGINGNEIANELARLRLSLV
jgi:hypothetical protein